MTNYNGPERRKNAVDTEHRFTLLEGIAETNKAGIEKIHARFSQFDHEQKAELRIATSEILERLDKKAEDCVKCQKDIEGLKTFGALVEKMAYIFGAAISTIGGWIFTHHDKIKAVKP